jgi:hypothetical protein
VMHGRCVAGAAWALELADVAVVGEHGFSEPLPSCGRVPAVAHSGTADGSRRSWKTRPSRSTSSTSALAIIARRSA